MSDDNLLFHPLATDRPLPERMNDPLNYEPHPLCREAAQLVCCYLAQREDWTDEVAAGKMFGVLVCRNREGQVGFLAAYSGQIQGRSDWPWFVPAVFDYLRPAGYFKQEEARITAMNHRIAAIETSGQLRSLTETLQQTRAEGDAAIAAYKDLMRASKSRRQAMRSNGEMLSAGTEEALIRESQFQKAELHRLKQRWRERAAEAEARLRPLADEVERLREERKQRSDRLQRWLFDRFEMLNGRGDRRTLTDIFRETPQGVPPAGSGECCAPKLLQYAYGHGLQPLAIAEFWQGRSPRMEIRHQGQFYTACRGKCKPILEWMLGGANEANGANEILGEGLKTLYADTSLLVVEKPAGLLSVPGREEAPSVESLLRQQYKEVYMVHRLDMDTSGLMVVALTQTAYHHLQKQFIARTLFKKYIALLDGMVSGEGTIRLPLRPDPLDRPRQVVDLEQGKSAITDYRVLGTRDEVLGTQDEVLGTRCEVLGMQGGGQTLVELIPHTGRTHQLRVHCAHQAGLNCPIVGDRLYGRPVGSLYGRPVGSLYGKPVRRLCLHAAELAFCHPATGERLSFSSPVPF